MTNLASSMVGTIAPSLQSGHTHGPGMRGRDLPSTQQCPIVRTDVADTSFRVTEHRKSPHRSVSKPSIDGGVTRLAGWCEKR